MLVTSEAQLPKRYRKAQLSLQIPVTLYQEISSTAKTLHTTNKAIVLEMIDFYLKTNNKTSVQEHAEKSKLK